MTKVLLSLIFFLVSPAWADSLPKVNVASDMSVDATKMSAEQLPMVVEMAAEFCTYCKLIEEKVLVPMILSGEYESKVLLRQVDIGETTELTDFTGEKISQSEFASRYKVYLTPTVLFLNHKGEEIAPRMTGVPLIDYYGIYLDEAIEVARLELQKSQ